MPETVDARGLACPQPVIETRNALLEHERVEVIVDNETAQYNVTRMAEKTGCQVTSTFRAEGIYLNITRSDAPGTMATPESAAVSTPAGSLVVSIPSEYMGSGGAELGEVLMRGFFHTLGEVQPRPDTIIFYNSGAKLVVEGSPVLEDIRALNKAGVEILACGTCLDYYELKELLAVGEISNMYTIVELLLSAGKVVSI